MLWWLLDTTLSVSLLAIVVAVACRLGRCSPAMRHALWLVVLAKFLLPPVIPSPWNPLDLASHDEVQARLNPAAVVTTDLGATSGPLPHEPLRATQATTLGSNAESMLPAYEERTIVGRRAAAVWASAWRTCRGVLDHGHASTFFTAVWLAALLFMAGRHCVWCGRLTRLGRSGMPAPQWLEKEVAAVAAMLEVHVPRLVVVRHIRTPFIWSLGSPRLFWPAALADQPEPRRWRGVIAHELAHLRRRDHWVAWVEMAAQCLWWWNPLFWYVRCRLRENAELACDAWAVAALPDSRQAYAETIVEVTELVSQTALPMPALGASSGARKTFHRRLAMIVRERVPCRLTWRGLLAASLLAVVALPSWLVAQSPRPKATVGDKPTDAPVDDAKPGQEVSGVVRAFDAGKNRIAISGKRLEKELVVSKDVRVLLDDGTGDRFGFQVGKLGDVAEGLPVILRLSPDQQVIGIWIEGPTLKGILKSVDAANHSVTVSVTLAKGEPEQDQAFEVAKNAKVEISHGKGGDKDKGQDPAKVDDLADLHAGALVALKLSADQKTVGRIQAQGPTVHGTLKSVDAAKHTLTLQVAKGKGEPGEEQTYDVPKDLKVVIDGALGKLADLPAEATVVLKLSLDGKAVSGIQVEGPHLYGVLKAVDAAKRTLTMHYVKGKGEPGEEHTYDVAKDAKVVIDGAGGTLADLPMDAPTTLKLSANQKEVFSIQVEGPTAIGVLKVVDADGRSISIAGKEGDKTFTVAEDAAVFIEDKPRKLADLPVDADVKVKLSADQKTARGVWAEGRTIQGVVRAVDEVNKEITIDIPKEGEAKFKLAEDSRVLGSDKARGLKLADLKVDKEVVLRFTADQKMVRYVVMVEE